MRRNSQSGLSLLEVMIVLAIIALIAGLAAPRLMGAFGRAKGQAAKIELTTLSAAVQLFFLDTGRYPTENEGLEALVSQPNRTEGWLGPYVEASGAIEDPWGRPYLYRFPGTSGTFDVLSLGRDGRTGGSGEDGDLSP